MTARNPKIGAGMVALALLAAVGLIAFWSSLNLPPETEGLGFLDYPLLLHKYDTFWQWLARDFPSQMHFIRPVPFFIQGLVVTGVEKHTVWLRLINLTALVLSGWLLFKLLRRENIGMPLSMLGGMILILHPVNVINALKIIHLGYLLGGMFCLLALNSYASFRDREKPPAAYLLEAVIIALMLLSYELYVVAPLLLLLYEFFIAAKAAPARLNRKRFPASLILWGGLVGGYLLMRFIAFGGVGGYQDMWEQNPLGPILKGGKWLSGWGFFHISGQPMGFLDLALFLVIAGVAAVIVLKRENRAVVAFALLWFVAASLPYFVITATYHYVFAFSLVGFILLLGVAFQRLTEGGVMSKAIGYASLFLLLMFWLYARFPATASIVAGIDDDYLPAKRLADQIGKGHEKTQVFLATPASDRHLQVRLDLLTHPEKVVLNEILPHLTLEEENRFYEADSSWTGFKLYALREGRKVVFEEDLASLLKAARTLNPPASDKPRRPGRKP